MHESEGVGSRRIMGADPAAIAAAEAAEASESWTQAAGSTQSVDGDPVCAAQRHTLGDATAGNGLRLRHELLAISAAVATEGRLEEDTRAAAVEVARS